MDLPIIDIADINDEAKQSEIAQQITEASREWGFLLLSNHTIPAGDIDQMFSLAKKFFVELPDEDKMHWPINQKRQGEHVAVRQPGYLTSAAEALPPFWRDHLAKVEEFKHNCHELVIRLLVCFALAMDLPDRNFFAKAHAEDAGNGNQFRLLCYPSRQNAPLQTTTRMSAHSDSGSVTLLFQTCQGLEIESPTGEWVPAPYLPGHILVNLGDALAFWSGGRLKATKHRVTFDGGPHYVERMSMAYFGAASPETVLEPLNLGDGQDQMEKYEANGVTIHPGISVGKYSKIIMENIYGSSVAQINSSEANKAIEGPA